MFYSAMVRKFYLHFQIIFSHPLQPSTLLKICINELVKKIVLLKPQFVALHMQEVGGKTYEKSMEYVQDFIKMLCESKELENYTRIRVYLDEDYTSAEHFTVFIYNFIELIEFPNINSKKKKKNL